MAEIFNFNDEKMIRECINAKQILDDHGDFHCDDWDIPVKAKVIHVMEWQAERDARVKGAFDAMIKQVKIEQLKANYIDEGDI